MGHGPEQATSTGETPMSQNIPGIRRPTQPFGPHRESSEPPNQPTAAQREPSVDDDQSNVRTYVKDIEQLLDSFRKGERTKFDIISSISAILLKDPNLSDQAKAQSLELYMAEISTTEAGSPRGRGGDKLPKKGNKRPREESDDSDESSGDDDEPSSSSGSSSGDDHRSTKKRRLRTSEMSWHRRKSRHTRKARSSCKKSYSILKTLSRDVKKAKLDLKLTLEAPDGFPSSEWEHIVKGEAVDLDHVLSSINRVTINSERKARLGDTEISFGSVESKRKVETSSDWTTAWRIASKATAFVFRHRRTELEDYGEYIADQFSSKHPSMHQQVILFDKAIRNLVDGGQRTLLGDHHKFHRFYSATLVPGGNEYLKSKPTNPTSNLQSKTDETCHKFNLREGCRYVDKACFRKHCCSGCGKEGHGQYECGRK